MNFEPRHERALERAVGALLPRQAEPEISETIRDLRDLERRLIGMQIVERKWDVQTRTLRLLAQDEAAR